MHCQNENKNVVKNMAGRRKKPTNIKVLHGTFRKDRNVTSEIQARPVKKIPPAPSWLDEAGRKEWKRVAKELHSMGLLTILDFTALEAYCVAYSRWQHAEKEIDINGFSYEYTNREGVQMMRKNPAVGIATESMKQMRMWLAEFGMTPSSRSKVSANPQNIEDPMEAFLNRGKKK